MHGTHGHDGGHAHDDGGNATAQFKGIIKVTAVNCNTQKKICDEYGVKEFPTLKVSLPLPLPSPPPSLHRRPCGAAAALEAGAKASRGAH